MTPVSLFELSRGIFLVRAIVIPWKAESAVEREEEQRPSRKIGREDKKERERVAGEATQTKDAERSEETEVSDCRVHVTLVPEVFASSTSEGQNRERRAAKERERKGYSRLTEGTIGDAVRDRKVEGGRSSVDFPRPVAFFTERSA